MAARGQGDTNAALAKTLREKLDVHGADLGAVVGRAGRSLPRALRRDAAALVQAEYLAAHPKLRHLADHDRLRAAEKRLKRHAQGLDPDKVRTDRRLGLLATIAFNLLLFAGILIGVLYWRGFIGPGAG